MTQEELDALPEMGGLEYTERMINGKCFRIPHIRPTAVLWTAQDEPSYVRSKDGQAYRVGWYDGIRYKQALLL